MVFQSRISGGQTTENIFKKKLHRMYELCSKSKRLFKQDRRWKSRLLSDECTWFFRKDYECGRGCGRSNERLGSFQLFWRRCDFIRWRTAYAVGFYKRNRKQTETKQSSPGH